MFNDDSSDGENGRCIGVRLFEDDDWLARPPSPGDDLKRSTKTPGVDLTDRRRTSLAGEFVQRSRRRHSAPSQARRRANSNPPAVSNVFEPLPRTKPEAKTTDDAEMIAAMEGHSGSTSFPIHSREDVEEIKKKLCQSGTIINKKSGYDALVKDMQ